MIKNITDFIRISVLSNKLEGEMKGSARIEYLVPPLMDMNFIQNFNYLENAEQFVKDFLL